MRTSMTLALSLTVTLTACTNSSAIWGGGGDGGSEARGDASDPSTDGATHPPRDGAVDGETDASACFNLVDDDDDGTLDCSEASCLAAQPLCCVGSTDSLCCTSSRTVGWTASDCEGVPCLAWDGASLVPSLGTVRSAGECSTAVFAPVGSASDIGALVIPEPLDLAASHVAVHARLGASGPTRETAAAGFGVFEGEGPDALARPLVAVLVSATDREMRVLQGDRTVYSEAFEAACGTLFALQLDPSGAFVVTREGMPVFDGDFEATRDARVAAFGRQPNPGEGAPLAWVEGLGIETRACEVLAPAAGDAALVLASDHDVRGVSVFPETAGSSDLDTIVAADGQLYWMDVRSDGRLVTGSSDLFVHVYQTTTWGDAFAIVDDVDVWVDTAGVHRVLLAVAPSESAPRSIAMAEWQPSSDGTRGAFTEPRIVLAPGTLGAVSVDGPSGFSLGGSDRFVFRARFADGHSELRLATLGTAEDGATPDTTPSSLGSDGEVVEGPLHSNRADDAMAFDRDELAEPEVFVTSGAIRVLYAGRRGTRWSIGSLVVSADLAYSAPTSDGVIVGPSESGFDALGARSPSLVRGSDTTYLYFAGTDGVRRGIGLATQPTLTSTP